jgi:hypothetical protein
LAAEKTAVKLMLKNDQKWVCSKMSVYFIPKLERTKASGVTDSTEPLHGFGAFFI